MFSLMMTFQISSAVAIKTQRELLESLDLESSKVVLRVLHALRNNHKPNLSTEFPPETLDRVEKAQHVINILSLFFNKKIVKINATRMQKLKEFQDRFQGEELLTYQRFLHEWQINKECKYGQRTPSLESNFEESITSEIMSDFILLEEPAPQTLTIASTSTLPTYVDLDILKVLSGFVLMDEYYSPIEGQFITSKVISAAEAARLSVPYVPSSLAAEPSTSTDTSLAIASLPSTLTDTPRVEDALLTPTVSDVLLQDLDKKSAKIILKSILNGYCIPFEEFNFKSKTDQDRYGKVVAYLLWVLHNKEEKVLGQKAALVPDNPRYRFDSDWYDSKLVKYEDYRKTITSPTIPSGKSFFANILSR